MKIRDGIAEIIRKAIMLYTEPFEPLRSDIDSATDQVLYLEIGGEVEEACYCVKSIAVVALCPNCNGTGKITRKRLLRDVVGGEG